MAKVSAIEEGALTPFIKKLMIYCGGGPLLDGYILCIIGAALAQLGPELNLDAHWSGLVGASCLIGLFFGGLVFGYLTDIFGRKFMYTLDLSVLVIGSILCMFVTTPMELVILRFIIGVAIGADYPIATALLAEFCPKSHRGFTMGTLLIWWFVGATLSDIVGYFLIDVPGGWKWMLGSAAIPGILLIIGRWGTPESPRWLMGKGRVEEARAVMKKVYGPNADIEDIEQNVVQTNFMKMFQGVYLSRTAMIGGFWLCLIVPLFAIYTFGPAILEPFGLATGKLAMLGNTLISALFVVGIIPCLSWVNKFGRRPMIIWSFAVMTFGLVILGLFPTASTPVIMFGFAVYALANGAPNVLCWLYPNELFPTEIRASAVGFGTAISRIGAAIGIYLLPQWLTDYGIGNTMLIMAGFTLTGLLIVAWLAPETKDLTLAQAAGSADTTSGHM
ncbi:MFS transporter [Sporomusa malonica]|uniref:MFS transporter, putative metabolite transport protein n=1 Tax=Sporomusa malonica TaxID=112901 RepID=A0A1W1ZD11_9FIRM|nr:MFS transporter [Sporomusa malonica]SMC46267.1 MFS transporter, putative metabolite transport protein [Sporomusa malonica]